MTEAEHGSPAVYDESCISIKTKERGGAREAFCSWALLVVWAFMWVQFWTWVGGR